MAVGRAWRRTPGLALRYLQRRERRWRCRRTPLVGSGASGAARPEHGCFVSKRRREACRDAAAAPAGGMEPWWQGGTRERPHGPAGSPKNEHPALAEAEGAALRADACESPGALDLGGVFLVAVL